MLRVAQGGGAGVAGTHTAPSMAGGHVLSSQPLRQAPGERGPALCFPLSYPLIMGLKASRCRERN